MRVLAALWLGFLVALSVSGTDEFGRGIGLTTFKALALSSAKGLLAVAVVVGAAITVAFLAYCAKSSWLDRSIGFVADLFDTVPSLLWILIVVVIVTQPRQLIPLVAFVIVALPSVTRVVISEVDRIDHFNFVAAARSLGTSTGRVFLRHIMPNTAPLLKPLSFQIAGSSIAIDGAIGLLGVGNRSDLNLGTLLVRGKEQFLFAPELLVIAMLAYLVLFATLFFFLRPAQSVPRN